MKRRLFLMVIAGWVGWVVAVSTAKAVDLNALKKKVEERLKKKQEPAPAAATVAAAAANASAVGPSIVCDARAKARLCYAFTGPQHKDEKKGKGNQMACRMFKGVYSQEATCAGENLLGRCVIRQGQQDEYWLSYYAGGKIDLNRAKVDCQNPKSGIHAQGAGVWIGG